jgi:hypothetical protein
LNLCRKEGKGKTRCAQTVSLPFSSLQQKFKAPHRAGTSKATIDHPCSRHQQHNAKQSEQHQQQTSATQASTPSVWPLTFLPLMAPWIFVSGRKKDGELSERSEFSPSPPGYKNPRGSRHLGRAFLCLLSLARQRK